VIDALNISALPVPTYDERRAPVMKLATIRDGRELLVVAVNEGFARPIGEVLPALSAEARTDMVALIREVGAPALRHEPLTGGKSLSSESLLAPIPHPPRNIFCVGKNYTSHAREFSSSGFDASSLPTDDLPTDPIIFTKPGTAVSAPFADIPLVPGLDDAVDYEAELGVVIGTGGRFISRADAMKHVFGYTVINDVTARDLQKRHKQWFLGKGIDGFCPMGPWIVTADELDPRSLEVSCTVNGEPRQRGQTGDMIFDIPALIETISKSLTLTPGDIIATGTPEGVGVGFNPPRFLKENDVVECSVSGIGTIRNTVRRMSPRS